MSARTFFLCISLLLLCPAASRAQSADDVASRIGTVARAMGTPAKEPWSVEATFATDLNRGNSDTTNVRSTLVYVADDGAWRFGSYLSGAFETKDARRANERAGLNLALARRFTPELRLVALQEIVRAPLDGLRARNLLGGMVVWSPSRGDALQTNVYIGSGWAHERLTTPVPRRDYGAGLTGGSVTLQLSPTAALNFVGSYMQDLASSRNFKLGSSVALKAAINTTMGMQLSYTVAYDHAPPAGKVPTNSAVSGALTLGWAAKP